MFCERCQNNEATIHLTELMKDIKSEVHLCEKCAREIGLNSKLSNFSLSIPEMLSFLDFNEVEEYKDSNKCKMCGYSFIDYSREGKLGCPSCYKYLGESLNSVVLSYHGNKKHIGRIPNNFHNLQDEKIEYPTTYYNQKSIIDLRKQLENAVFEERYEDAAVIRDKIKNFVE